MGVRARVYVCACTVLDVWILDCECTCTSECFCVMSACTRVHVGAFVCEYAYIWIFMCT